MKPARVKRPYTAWHLSYVLLGASLAPAPDPRIVAGALLAFFLGVGVAAHSFDELQGRPLGTRIPSGVLVVLGSFGLLGAVALGLVAAAQVGGGLLVFVVAGAALVLLYGLEAPLVHSDLGFALGWGGFPVMTAAFATGAPPVPVALVAVAASLLSLAQRRLSTPVRRIRRRATAITGVVRYRDGSTEALGRDAWSSSPATTGTCGIGPTPAASPWKPGAGGVPTVETPSRARFSCQPEGTLPGWRLSISTTAVPRKPPTYWP